MHKHSPFLLSSDFHPFAYPPLIDYELENAVIAKPLASCRRRLRDVLLIFSPVSVSRVLLPLGESTFYIPRLDFRLSEIAVFFLILRAFALTFLPLSPLVRSSRLVGRDNKTLGGR